MVLPLAHYYGNGVKKYKVFILGEKRERSVMRKLVSILHVCAFVYHILHCKICVWWQIRLDDSQAFFSRVFL